MIQTNPLILGLIIIANKQLNSIISNNIIEILDKIMHINSKLNMVLLSNNHIQNELIDKLSYELCIKQNYNVNLILEEIINKIKEKNNEEKQICVQQLKKLIKNDIKHNMKDKLQRLIILFTQN